MATSHHRRSQTWATRARGVASWTGWTARSRWMAALVCHSSARCLYMLVCAVAERGAMQAATADAAASSNHPTVKPPAEHRAVVRTLLDKLRTARLHFIATRLLLAHGVHVARKKRVCRRGQTRATAGALKRSGGGVVDHGSECAHGRPLGSYDQRLRAALLRCSPALCAVPC